VACQEADMKLFNVIAIFDTYLVAESSESARDALLKLISGGADVAIYPDEITSTESKMERSIRPGCYNDRPFLADDVSDDDFKKCRGKTTIQIFNTIYKKQGV
jgi:hypothetical protein